MHTPFFSPWRSALASLLRRPTTRPRVATEIESQFGAFLPPELLRPSSAGVASRRRQFFLSRTFWLFIWQVLQPRTACRTVVRQAQAFCGTLSVSSSAFCQARARLPLETLQAAMQQTAQTADRASGGVPGWSRPIRVADATCIRLPDTAKNRAVYPYAGCQRPGCGFPVMKVLGLFSLAGGGILKVVQDGWKTSEMRLFRRLREWLRRGDILLGDRAFCTWFVLARLPVDGIDVVVRLNGRRLLEQGHPKALGPGEWLACWKRPDLCPPYLTPAEWLALPGQITVRIIHSSLERPGFRTHELWLCTTLLDPELHPAAKIAQLYLRRWEMELCFRDLKTTMGMEELRCLSPDMIAKELLAFLTAHNFLRCLMAQAATTHAIPRTRISFKGTVDAARSFHQAMRLARSRREIRELHARLLAILARDALPYRPDRAEPRVVKRRPKPYRRLTRWRHLYPEHVHPGRAHSPCLS